MLYGLVALVCIIIAAVLFGIYYKKKKEEEEKRGILVVAGTVLFVYLFPSAALFIIGLICFLLFLGAVL